MPAARDQAEHRPEHTAEQAALRRRIADLRAEANSQIAEAAEPVKAARAGYEGELSGRRAEFAFQGLVKDRMVFSGTMIGVPIHVSTDTGPVAND